MDREGGEERGAGPAKAPEKRIRPEGRGGGVFSKEGDEAPGFVMSSRNGKPQTGSKQQIVEQRHLKRPPPDMPDQLGPQEQVYRVSPNR